MSLTLTSTVAPALAQLLTYFETVAAGIGSSFAGGPVSVSMGAPIAKPSNNYLMVGHWENGQLIQNYEQTFAGMPAVANKKFESYEVPCSTRIWSGDSTPTDRITELATLMDSIQAQFANDPNGSGAISPSGTWECRQWQIESSGPLGGKGWGVIASLVVAVFNVQIAN